ALGAGYSRAHLAGIRADRTRSGMTLAAMETMPLGVCRYWRRVRRVTASWALVILCVALVSDGALAQRQQTSAAPLGANYLLLVNTAIARQLKSQDISAFDAAPYEGLAIAFHYNYDTAPVFSSESMSSQLGEWKKLTGKDLWPWVYINRMLGA